MRVLIVDDEAPARRRLRRLLEAIAGVTIVGEAGSGPAAVEAVGDLAPDLVLLDIQMPGLDGFGVIEQVGADRMPPVIFVTAYDAHALRAFEVHALDYLLKPVGAERLSAAIARVWSLLDHDAAPPAAPTPAAAPIVTKAADAALGGRLDALLQSLGRPRALRHLMVQDGPRSVLLPVAQLVRASAERNYVRLFAADGASYVVRGTITALAERLDPEQFLRAGRGDLVRVSAIREMHPWSHGDYHLVLQDGTRVVWSRRYRAREEGRFGAG